MRKVLKVVLGGLFILSINLFSMEIDTRKPENSYKVNQNVIWTDGLYEEQYKDYWRDYMADTNGWVEPTYLLAGLKIKCEGNLGNVAVGSFGELIDIIIDAEYDLKDLVRIEGVVSSIPGERYIKAIQYKIIDEATNEIKFIFSMRKINLLPYGNLSWDLDSAELVLPFDGVDSFTGPTAVFCFVFAISSYYKIKYNELPRNYY